MDVCGAGCVHVRRRAAPCRGGRPPGRSRARRRRELRRAGRAALRHRAHRRVAGARERTAVGARDRRDPRPLHAAPRRLHGPRLGRGRGARGAPRGSRHPHGADDGRTRDGSHRSGGPARGAGSRPCPTRRRTDLHDGNDRRPQGRDADAPQSALHRQGVEHIAQTRSRRPRLRRAADIARLRPGVGLPGDALRRRVPATGAALFAAGIRCTRWRNSTSPWRRACPRCMRGCSSTSDPPASPSPRRDCASSTPEARRSTRRSRPTSSGCRASRFTTATGSRRRRRR